MNEENKKIIWSEILKAGDELKNTLPDHPNHPNGRNPYAHIALEIKNKYKSSYKDLDDDKINEIRKFIEFVKSNPN